MAIDRQSLMPAVRHSDTYRVNPADMRTAAVPEKGGTPRALMQASEGRFWALLSHAPVGVFVMNPEGDCEYANQRGCEMAGEPLERLLGTSWAQALHPDDSDWVQETWAEAAAAQRDFAMEFRFRRRDGTICWVESTGSVVHDADGQLLGWLGVAVDLTARKLSEAQLEQSMRERALLLGRMLHAAEHERTLIADELHDGPIQHLASFGYSLDRVARHLTAGETTTGLDLLAQVRADVTLEVEGLRRLMAELRPPILDDRGLEAALREYTADFQERTAISCVFTGEIDGARLAEDSETVVYRVTQEALTNVAKYSHAEKVDVELRRSGPSLSLVVEDNGVGFDTSRLGELGRDGHLGLLSMCERVAGADGVANLLSAPGLGTRIEVVLPWRAVGATTVEPHAQLRARSVVAGDPTEDTPADNTGVEDHAATVLVVDDEPAVVHVLTDLLLDAGFTIAGHAATGAEAVELAEALRPDLVLMDMRMPTLNGCEAARMMLARDPELQVVLLSGEENASAISECRELGVFDVVAKGGDAKVVADTLRSAARHRRKPDGQMP